MEASQVLGNPFEGFDHQIQEDADSQLHLGEIHSDLEFCGHTFGLRTLLPSEEFAASIAIQPYRNTIKEPDAWITAQIGLALTHIDSDDSFCPQAGPDLTQFARARFQYMSKNWYWPVHDALYQEYTRLLARQLESIRAVQDLSERSRPTFLPLADSLSAQGTISDEMASGTPGLV